VNRLASGALITGTGRGSLTDCREKIFFIPAPDKATRFTASAKAGLVSENDKPAEGE